MIRYEPEYFAENGSGGDKGSCVGQSGEFPFSSQTIGTTCGNSSSNSG
jgi:hypothetical protein